MSDINTSSMLAVGTMLNGRYRIERHLSSGGFGNTYLARNLIFNDLVAVKEFFLRGITQRDGDSTISVSNSDNKLLFDEQLEKFKKEAQRIRQLRSPHIVRVHDLFEANGTAYYVMDYIDGESLAARMIRTGLPLTETETRKYLGQVLEALSTIHSVGLLHMDLKPDNIMVDKDDNAVLIDFGASKRSANEQLTSTVTAVSYTSGYAPPEQIEQDSDHFGPWTDIYALGATLYQLLTDRKPPMPSAIYSDPTADKHHSLKFPEIVSGQMRQLITKMMTVVWHERPQSVEDVQRLIGQNEAPHAVPPTVPPSYDPLNTSVETSDNNNHGYGGGYDGTYDGNYGSTYDSSYVEAYEEESSSSRKWVYMLIGVLAAILLGGGIVLYDKLSKTESENDMASAESVPDTNDLQDEAPSTLQLAEASETKDKAGKKDADMLDKGSKQEQVVQPAKVKEGGYEEKTSSSKGQVTSSSEKALSSPAPAQNPPTPKKEDNNKVYDVVEQQPSFPGGQGAMFSWLSQNIRYPAAAQRNGIQGRVMVSFVVEKNGSVSDVRVLKSVDPLLDNEAVRVVKAMPKWSPGKLNGQAVRVKYTLPISFKTQ